MGAAPDARPYVDRPVTDLAAATRAAAEALVRWGITGRPELLRLGMNALFTVPGTDLIVRVGRATAPASAAHHLARALDRRAIATVVPRLGSAADVDGFAVTGWHRVRATGGAIDWERIGDTVRRVHALDRDALPADYPLPSPTTFPWWDFDGLLAEVGGELDHAARAGIVRAVDRHRGWTSRVTVDVVVCHGDVHPGNVMVSAPGPLLIDWDLMCMAPPAWDHAMLTTYAARWGGAPAVYPAFASGYGRALVEDELTLALAELRNVAATLMRVRAGRTDPAAAEEAERRLRYWRGDPDAPMWRAQ